MKLIWLLNLVLAIAAYGTFIWGAWSVFRKVTDKDPLGWKIVKICASISKVTIVICILMTRTYHWPTALAGALCFVCSKALFWRCVKENKNTPLTLAYSPDLPSHVVRTGPYRWVRHPFYVSYLLGYIAGVLATGQPLLLAIVFGMGVIYYHAARTEEGKFARSPMRDAYAAYKARTGMFFPKFWAFSASEVEETSARRRTA